MKEVTKKRPSNVASDHPDLAVHGRRSSPAQDVGKTPLVIARAQRISEQVYRRLRQSILSGELGPDSRLRETEIAEGLGVSRTPVREAISRLIGDRLVRELLAGGVEVVDTRAEMEEIYAIREALEVCAVGLASSRINERQLARMEEIVETAEAISYRQHSRRSALNQAFHLVIAEAARAPRLAALIVDFGEYSLNASWLSQQTEESARAALEDHRAIISGLRIRDREKAEAAVREHLGRSYRHMLLSSGRRAWRHTDEKKRK